MIFYVMSNILYTRDIPGFPLPYIFLTTIMMGNQWFGLPYYVECKCLSQLWHIFLKLHVLICYLINRFTGNFF